MKGARVKTAVSWSACVRRYTESALRTEGYVEMEKKP